MLLIEDEKWRLIMIEMRREKRWPAKLHLEISNLFKQDYVKVENINEIGRASCRERVYVLV